MRTQTKETQSSLSPRQALNILLDGNKRFINNLRYNRNLLQQVNETSANQFPVAIVLSCIDSRTSAELVFDQGLGDIFSVRVAGNVLNDDILGSMEFACQVAGSKLVLVLGHTSCGAVKGACNHVEMGHLTGLLEKIQPSVERVLAHSKSGDGSEFTKEQLSDEVSSDNVVCQMRQIEDRSSILRHLLRDGKIGIVGAMYSVESGEVRILEERFSTTPPTT